VRVAVSFTYFVIFICLIVGVFFPVGCSWKVHDMDNLSQAVNTFFLTGRDSCRKLTNVFFKLVMKNINSVYFG